MTPDLELDLCDNEWSLTKKLRIEDPEQFHILVRMHLSFVLDLNTDETDSSIEEKSKLRPFKWSFTSFSKKTKNSKGLVEGEGVPLTEDLISQINQLVDFVSIEENISQEGIFRKSGSTSRQQELKNLLGQSNSIELDGGQFSVHDCASVLKCYLAELPEPVLTEVYYPAYCQIAELCFDSDQPHSRLLRSIQLLLLLLPLDNYNLFKKLITLLHLTASHASENRMSSQNLATLFTPHLLCPRKLSPESLHTSAAVLSKILVFMIDNANEIFLVPDTLATDVKAYWAKKERKLKSPVKDPINDSIMDSSAVNTVFTFVDREKTAQENTENATEAALAQLYAYIQALPESSKKRRLVKQFNKENGHGTPAVVAKQTPGPVHSSGKHFGDSIKKHIFSKGLRNKLNNQMNGKAKTKLETMLTPRSRKPVVALSGTNLCHLATFDSPLLLPSSNDDLPTATVDLTFSQESLSDSMIKTLEEDTPDLSDTEDGVEQGIINLDRETEDDETLFHEDKAHVSNSEKRSSTDISSRNRLLSTTSSNVRSGTIGGRNLAFSPIGSNERKSVEIGGAVFDTYRGDERDDLRKGNSSVNIKWGQSGSSLRENSGSELIWGQSGSSLRENSGTTLKWGQSGSSLRENSGTTLKWTNQNTTSQFRENSDTDLKLVRQSSGGLYNRGYSDDDDSQNQRAQDYSMDTNTSCTIDSKNPMARNSLNMDKTMDAAKHPMVRNSLNMENTMNAKHPMAINNSINMMDTTDGGRGNGNTPPSGSRKRSSQNNNNDETTEVKKCLRESNSSTPRVHSETAL